mmetsp:Transcript_30211/g.98261  ORF Transcript_30211/g.98261 Transcript_30211/m.98261 type:complete len:764 (+) Transcript_30211:1556-3847(+)
MTAANGTRGESVELAPPVAEEDRVRTTSGKSVVTLSSQSLRTHELPTEPKRTSFDKSRPLAATHWSSSPETSQPRCSQSYLQFLTGDTAARKSVLDRAAVADQLSWKFRIANLFDEPFNDGTNTVAVRKPKPWYIIHPYSLFRRYWDVWLMTLLLYVALVLPFTIGFDADPESGSALWIVDRNVDAFFIVDIFFSFLTGIIVSGDVCLKPRRIALDYMRTWLGLDVVSAFPFDLVAESQGMHNSGAYRSAKLVRIMKLMRLIKLFRVLRLNRILSRLETRTTMKYGVMQLIKFCVVIAFSAHWLSCAWYLCFTLEEDDGEWPRWVDIVPGKSVEDQDYMAKYIACFYWAIMTMSTIGYGDIVPVTTEERVVAIFCMLVGAAVFGYGITQACALVANLNAGDVQFQRLMDDLNEYFDYRHIPSPLRMRVREYFHFKRHSASSMFFQEDDLLTQMSDGLKLEVLTHVNQKLLRTVPFLRDANEDFINSVVDKLQKAVYGPQEMVMMQGEIGNQVFFIASGSVDVLVGMGRGQQPGLPSRDRFGTTVASLYEGDMVGEIALCVSSYRAASVRTKTYCELYSLDRTAFTQAVRHDEAVLERIRMGALKRLRHTLRVRLWKAVRIVTCANAFLASVNKPSLCTDRRQPSDPDLAADPTVSGSKVVLDLLNASGSPFSSMQHIEQLAAQLSLPAAPQTSASAALAEVTNAMDRLQAIQMRFNRIALSVSAGGAGADDPRMRDALATLLSRAGSELDEAANRLRATKSFN